MAWQYQKHYTREEARALLPSIRQWLAELERARKELKRAEEHMIEPLSRGYDLGGQIVSRWVHLLADINTILAQFQNREIEIKDLERGLVDFPAFVGGKEVYLCWEKDEEDIEFWHDLTSGYAGRQPIE